MNMDAYTRNIKDILSLDRKYTIPRFQREYAWEKPELLTMYDDIFDQIKLTDNIVKISEYFIGSLVLVGDDTKDTKFIIVDGQQRITTITIILSVIGEKFLELGEQKLAQSIHKYIVGYNDDGDDYYKLENENPKPFLQLRIQSLEKELKKPTSDEEKKLLNAYEYFDRELNEKNIRKKQKYLQNISYLDILKAVRDQVLKFKTIYITVSEIDTAYTIFETLNAKGKDLASVDLIKNKIFQLLNTDSPIDKPREVWKEMQKTLFNSKDKINMSIFYRHFWLSKYSKATESKLYEQFLRHISPEKDRYIEFLDELNNSSEWYSKIASPLYEDWNRSEEVGIFLSLDALKLFDTKQVRSILLALCELRYDDKKISEKYFKKAIRGLEHFHFLFTAIASSRASWLDGVYSKYARNMRNASDKNKVHMIIEELLKELNEGKPTFEVFKSNFKNIYYLNDSSKDKKLIKYIFRKIEIFLQKNDNFIPPISSIEHIYSQSSEQNSAYNNLGNLIPLEQDINSKIGNKKFRDKLNYYKKSNYKLTQIFCEKFDECDEWTNHELEIWFNYIVEKAYQEIWIM
ncbi:Uncharacterized conserved protein [Staphylococcus aureus]|nr:Uncharacterized conserved protein [Staphylococcus aureus]CAC6827410.1 Uncharacterized conserved protein [Staphylococcus aureus]CAC6951132.1 Uncharacterized conserved protein [Staphylococcus aureus]CAC6965518.1 Uncharacterized conserved protein [Staphylococcus aureus]